MKLQALIDLLEHTKKTLGPDAEVIFQQGHGDARKDFSIGEQMRQRYESPTDFNRGFMITPYETHQYVDGWKRFILPIARIGRLEPTEEINQAFTAGLKACGISEEAIRKSFADEDKRRKLHNAALQHEFS